MAVKLGNGKWAVKENNLLAYNDNSGQFFNKEFDFTRGSSATYVGKDGLIKTAGLQDTNLVQNGDFSQLGSELVINGGFTGSSDEWNESGTWTYGNNNEVCTGNGTNQMLTQSGILTSGKFYTYSLDIISSTLSSQEIRVYIGGNDYITHTLNGGVETITGYKVSAGSNLVIRVTSANTSGILTIDNVSVKQVDPNDEWTLGSGWSYGDGKAISTNSTNSNLENDSISIANGKQYKFTFEITDFTGNGFVRPQLGAVGAVIGTYVQGNGVYSQILIANNNFDRIVLRTGGGDGFNGSVSNISVQEVQVNTPRIDFSDSADGALLLEPQSTNLINYSEDFSQSYWTKGNSSIVSNNATSPDGSLNADKLVEDTNNSSHYCLKTFSVVSGDYYTYSIIAKYNGRNLQFGGSTGFATDYINYDLQNGVIAIQTGAATGTITNLNNGYYRCTYTAQSNATSVSGLIIPALINSLTSPRFPTYQGDGSSGVYIWGAQLEEQSYATSYIPTQGSTSTRIAETCNNSGSAQDFNSEEGVLYAEIASLADDGTYKYITMSDGTNSNRLVLGSTASAKVNYRIVSSLGASINMVYNNINVLSFNKIAASYKQNEFDLWVNGVKVLTSSTGNVFSANVLNTLDFRDGNGTANFYGKTKNIQVFTKALSDEELEYISSYRSLNELVTALKLNTL